MINAIGCLMLDFARTCTAAGMQLPPLGGLRDHGSSSNSNNRATTANNTRMGLLSPKIGACQPQEWGLPAPELTMVIVLVVVMLLSPYVALVVVFVVLQLFVGSADIQMSLGSARRASRCLCVRTTLRWCDSYNRQTG